MTTKGGDAALDVVAGEIGGGAVVEGGDEREGVSGIAVVVFVHGGQLLGGGFFGFQTFVRICRRESGVPALDGENRRVGR